jgi:hypothetical protein
MAENSTATARKRGPGRPFVKGQSGNAGGRPKKDRAFEALVQDYLAAQDKEAKMARGLRLISVLYSEAVAGNVPAARELMDRGFGKVAQRIEVAHDDVVAKVKMMAKERGLSQEDTARAVREAEEMLARGES